MVCFLVGGMHALRLHRYTILTHATVDAALDVAADGDGLAILAGLVPSVSGDPMVNAVSTTNLSSAQVRNNHHDRVFLIPPPPPPHTHTHARAHTHDA
jgi:hypothetical protein